MVVICEKRKITDERHAASKEFRRLSIEQIKQKRAEEILRKKGRRKL
jgi:cell division protein FtsL